MGVATVERPLTHHWKVRYHVTQNNRGESVVGRLEILPSRSSDIVTDPQGVTMALIRQVRMASVRWILKAQTVRVSPEARPLKPNRRGARKTSKDLLELLARYQQLAHRHERSKPGEDTRSRVESQPGNRSDVARARPRSGTPEDPRLTERLTERRVVGRRDSSFSGAF